MYDHTQTGWIIIWTVGGFALLCILFPLFVDVPDEGALLLYSVTAILVLALLLFYNLRVSVGSRGVFISFGVGLIRKTFPIQEIIGMHSVSNQWICGWGIHYCQRAWLFNVHGFKSVELTMKNGKKYRIGTDEPDRLMEAIHSAQGS